MEGQKNFLIYGSTGYTGRLVVAEALRRGLRPVLAGRNVEKIGRQAAALGLEWRAFRLSDTRALERALVDTGLALLLAGPFGQTSRRVVEACLRTGTHCLDINGELEVYEKLARYDSEARSKGVMLGTGMGFDVVPSDCLARYLKNCLPTANELRLAFISRGQARMSHGTLRSGLEELQHGMRVRRRGQLVQAQPGEKSMVVDFGWGPRSCDLMSWGDVVTAYYSSGFSDIEVYSPGSSSLQRQVAILSGGQRILGWGVMRSLARRMIGFLPDGATAEARAQTSAVIWGQARDPSGCRVAARLHTMEAYELTARTAIQAVVKALAGEVKPGFQTPSMAFGADFILEIEGVRREDIEP